MQTGRMGWNAIRAEVDEEPFFTRPVAEDRMLGTIDVFLSGVTSEFKVARTELGNRLKSLFHRQVDVHVQESFSNDSVVQPFTVNRLISNVHQSELVVCLVGFNSGFPQEVKRRLEIQALAEQILLKEHQIPVSDLWNRWKEGPTAGYGMTYTQLELFLGTCAFKGPAKRLVVLAPETSHAGWRDSTGRYRDPSQRAFFDHVADSSERMERSTISDLSDDIVRNPDRIVLDALQHCLDFFLFKGRTRQLGHKPQSTTQQQLRAALDFLDEERAAKRLKHSSYDYFYEILFDVFRESHAFSIQGSRNIPIGCLVEGRPILIARSSNSKLLSAVHTMRGIEVASFGSDGTCTNFHCLKGTQDHLAFACSQDLRTLLTAHNDQWYLSNVSGDGPQQVTAPFQCSSHGTLPQLHSDSNGIWLRSDRSTQWISATGSREQPSDHSSSVETVLGRLIDGAFHVHDQLLIVRQTEQTPETTSIQLFQREEVEIGRLFQIAEQRCELGEPTGEVWIDVERDPAELVVPFNQGQPEPVEGVRVPLPNSEGIRHRMASELRGDLGSPTFPEVTEDEDSKNAGNSMLQGKQVWFCEREFLITVASLGGDSGAVVKVFRFPRSCDPEEAADFTSWLRRVLDGTQVVSCCQTP